MNHEPFFRLKSRLKIREYAEGCRLYDLRRGNSKGREWKSSVFFVLVLLMIFVLSLYEFRITRVPVVSLILVLSIYMCTHYVYILPRKARLKGEHIFRSSRLLSKEYTFEFYKDYFIMNNEFEFMKRYYSEITDCIETDELFLLGGGMYRKVVVISKRCLDEKTCTGLSEFFQNELVRQYRRTRPLKKGKES